MKKVAVDPKKKKNREIKKNRRKPKSESYEFKYSTFIDFRSKKKKKTHWSLTLSLHRFVPSIVISNYDARDFNFCNA